MYTQCTHCSTLYRINTAQLTAARGQVRCGSCHGVFNALDALAEHIKDIPKISANLPAGQEPVAATKPEFETARDREAEVSWDMRDAADDMAFASPPLRDMSEEIKAPENLVDLSTEAADQHIFSMRHIPGEAASLLETAPTYTEQQHTEAAKEQAEFEVHLESTAAGEMIAPAQKAEAVHPGITTTRVKSPTIILPSAKDTRAAYNVEQSLKTPPPKARLKASSSRTSHWLGTVSLTLGCLVLIALLGLQYGYFYRNDLSHYPELRPWLIKLCELAQCEISLQRDISRITLMDRLVHSHPTHKDALQINATLVNEAEFAQPYPVLELRFTDTGGNAVAGRRFQPSEYLKPGTDMKQGMTPRTPVTLSLEIVDPGKNAVGFEFSLW